MQIKFNLAVRFDMINTNNFRVSRKNLEDALKKHKSDLIYVTLDNEININNFSNNLINAIGFTTVDNIDLNNYTANVKIFNKKLYNKIKEEIEKENDEMMLGINYVCTHDNNYYINVQKILNFMILRKSLSCYNELLSDDEIKSLYEEIKNCGALYNSDKLNEFLKSKKFLINENGKEIFTRKGLQLLKSLGM